VSEIFWILTARYYHIFTRSSQVPRAWFRRNMRRDFRSVTPCNPDASVYTMYPLRHMFSVGHNAGQFLYNWRLTEREETAKGRSEGVMQRDTWYWRWAQSNQPRGCLCPLWLSASTVGQPFRPDRNLFSWCSTKARPELSKVLSDSEWVFSDTPEATCSYAPTFRMLWDLTDRILKSLSSWDFESSLKSLHSSTGDLMQYSHRSGS